MSPLARALPAALLAGAVLSQKCIQPGWRNASYVRTTPGPETIDYSSSCQPWADKTCCTASYTRDLAAGGIGGIYPGFSYDFCGPISAQCRQFMQWEECFYACDPYAAYFEDPIVSGSFKNLPLCTNFCDDWYDACKDDSTCVTDWSDWPPLENGTYVCPQGLGSCSKFSQRFSGGSDMCRRMWGSNFITSSDPKKCFSPWFYSVNPNINAAGIASGAGAVAGGVASAVVAAAAAVGVLAQQQPA